MKEHKYVLCRVYSDGKCDALILGNDKAQLSKSIKTISTPFDAWKYEVRTWASVKDRK